MLDTVKHDPSPPDTGNILLDCNDPEVAALVAALTQQPANDPPKIDWPHARSLDLMGQTRCKWLEAREYLKDGDYDTYMGVLRKALSLARECRNQAGYDRQIGRDPERDSSIFDDAAKMLNDIQAEYHQVYHVTEAQRMRVIEPLLMAQHPKPAATPEGGYTKERLREITGLSNTTLSSYAKAAGVPIATKGGRNYRYPIADVRTILQWIIDTSSEHALVERCKKAIVDLPKSRNNREITEISR